MGILKHLQPTTQTAQTLIKLSHRWWWLPYQSYDHGPHTYVSGLHTAEHYRGCILLGYAEHISVLRETVFGTNIFI